MAIDPQGACSRCRAQMYIQDDTVPQMCDHCIHETENQEPVEEPKVKRAKSR